MIVTPPILSAYVNILGWRFYNYEYLLKICVITRLSFHMSDIPPGHVALCYGLQVGQVPVCLVVPQKVGLKRIGPLTWKFINITQNKVIIELHNTIFVKYISSPLKL